MCRCSRRASADLRGPVALAERGQSLDLGGYAAGLYHVHLVVEGRWVSGAKVVVE